MIVLLLIEAAIALLALAAWTDARRRRSADLRARIARYGGERTPETGP